MRAPALCRIRVIDGFQVAVVHVRIRATRHGLAQLAHGIGRVEVVAIDPDDELTSRLLDAEVVRRRGSAVAGADYAHTWVADVSDDLKGAHRGAVADH